VEKKLPVALITGVGPGTGSEMVRRFARGGYAVAMLARTSERLASLEKEVEHGIRIGESQVRGRVGHRRDDHTRIADGKLHGQATTKAGKPYNNTYCMVFRIANGKVQELTEYCDTELITAAFGK
jgi:ketosteroid isomerase-like protein